MSKIPTASEAAKHSNMALFQQSEYSDLTAAAIEQAINEGKTKAGTMFLPTVPDRIVKGCADTLLSMGYTVEMFQLGPAGIQVNACW